MHGACGPTGSFGGLLRLDGSSTLPDDFAQTGVAATPSGQALPLTLAWTVLAAPPPGLSATTFVHLEDVNGHRWSQVEQDAYPAEQWAAGETIVQRVDVPVPPGAPPGVGGLYRLRLGLFDPAGGARLPFTDAATGLTTDAATTEAVAIAAGLPPEPLPRPPFPVNQPVVAGLTFLGYERGAEALETGEVVDVGLWWSAEAPLPYLLMNLTLVGVDNGVIRPFGRAQPFYNLFPFSQWPTPIFVIDRQTARIPDDVATGDYRLRLELFDGGGQPLYQTDLNTLTITQTAREFSPPPLAMPVGASFGGEIALLGYTLTEADAGWALELVWQAKTQPSADYTVFVHVLNADGTCCLWQADAMPRGGAYPTNRWLAGEVVTDTYVITLPGDTAAGAYAVEVGLYRAETGARLPVTQDGQAAGDAVRLGSLEKP
jgi:hypothetical protein